METDWLKQHSTMIYISVHQHLANSRYVYVCNVFFCSCVCREFWAPLGLFYTSIVCWGC